MRVQMLLLLFSPPMSLFINALSSWVARFVFVNVRSVMVARLLL